MPDSFPEKPSFSITFDPIIKQLEIIWQGNVELEELREGYTKALEIIKNKSVKKILIDVSQRKLNSNVNPEKLFGLMFGEALKLIADNVFLALVISKEEYFLETEASRFGGLQDNPNNYIIVNQFISRSEAEAWLATAN